MFAPKYTITNSMLKQIGTIDASKEVFEYVSLNDEKLAMLHQGIREKTVFHNLHMEGNQLTLEQVQTLLSGQAVPGQPRDIQEAINLRNVFQYIDHIVTQIGPGNPYVLSLDTLLQMHQLMTDQVLTPESSGHLRAKQVVVRNAKTGEISYTPPPATEVPYLMEDLVNWINEDSTKELHPLVKAGLIHCEIARIHPFLDANHRLARAVGLLVLYLDGYVLGKGFCFEQHFDQDPMLYYSTLQNIFSQQVMEEGERDLNPWLEYFLPIAATEFNSRKEQVLKIDQESKTQNPGTFMFNDRQLKIINFLQHNQLLRNRDFGKIFPDYSDDTVLRELKYLKENNIIKKIGGTKNAGYVLV
jgi:Fic family protein